MLLSLLVGCQDKGSGAGGVEQPQAANGAGPNGSGASGGVAQPGSVSDGGVGTAAMAGTSGTGVSGAGGTDGTAGTAGMTGMDGAGAGGADPMAGASAIPATFATIQSVITQAPCFGAGCHNDDQNPLKLVVDDDLYARLTTGVSDNCGGIPIVNPGNPQQSALVMLLRGPCGETPRMPLGCVNDQDGLCVPAEYIEAIEAWIAAGAAQQ